MTQKIGISIPVEEPALNVCLALNRQISSLTKSDVMFGKSGNSAPHVTIALGLLRENVNVGKIEQEVRVLARQISGPMCVSLGSPYRESTTGHYIVSDVVLSEDVQNWRLLVQGELSQFFVEEGRTSAVPHLTLGHVSARYADVDDFLAERKGIPGYTTRNIDIAISGPRGIKAETLGTVIV